MVYSSLLFIYGSFPAALLMYYVTPKKYRSITLLILSILFCGMLSIWYLAAMAVYIAVNYAACHIIGKYVRRPAAALPFGAAVVFDITMLFVFRTELFTSFQKTIKMPEGFFPLGISFITLSAIGLLVDVYTGRVRGDSDIVTFILYFLYFPKLLMGPLMRFGSFAKTLSNRRYSLRDIGIGMTIFVKGLAKKVIAADSLYMLYKSVTDSGLEDMSALTAWLGITAYVLCFYYTLSGVSDMGTGISYCFGIRLPQSFNYPMFSTRIKYFAARWHIQAVQWFRRYVTKPLSGISRRRWIRRLIFVAVWGLFGSWYGMSLGGAVWGLIIGAAVLAENKFSRNKALGITGAVYTFIVTAFAGVFMAGSSLRDSFNYLLVMLGGNRIFADSLSLYLTKSYIVILLICVYASTDLFRNMLMRSGRSKLRTAVGAVSPLIVLAFMVLCTILMSYSGASEIMLIKM